MLEKKYNFNKNKKLELMAYALIMLIIVFVSDGKNISITYLKYPNKTLLIFISVFIFFVLSLFSKRSHHISTSAACTTFILLLYAWILFLSTIINDAWYGWAGNITSILICLLSVLFFSHTSEIEIDRILDKLNSFIIIVVFLQVVFTSINLMSVYGFFSPMYKMLFEIPIGLSNSIAVFMTPLFVSLFAKSNKSKYTIFLMALSFASILLVMNRSAIITIVVIIIITKQRLLYKKIQKEKFYRYFIIFILIVLALIIIENNHYISMYLFGRIQNSDLTLNDLTSGRINILFDKFSKISTRPLLGFGAGYESEFSNLMRAHNWIIEVIERTGIIGLLVYTSAIVIPFVKTNRTKYFNEKILRVRLMVISILIISLMEPGLFSPKTDFLFGSLLGILFSLIRINKNKV